MYRISPRPLLNHAIHLNTKKERNSSLNLKFENFIVKNGSNGSEV